MDDHVFVDPAALNANAAASTTIAPGLLSQPSPRGTKRSRSPDLYGGAGVGAAALTSDPEPGESLTTKRSRSSLKQAASKPMPLAPPVQPVETPHVRSNSLSQASPSQASPQRSTPGSAKPPVLKALPTVRDHTTDQLGPDNDEYLPRETDADGELKVSKDGYPQGGRKYKCRTFRVPHRGEKLFMLATECARVLGYRDSYLLFNKNRSLYKIIANQQEKDDLIHQEILPYSYRSRQIAIVTARSMFRQFGSRLIEGGRRVRDDYWEAKARKQGFTEEDAAGEKRPGAAKAREQAAAEATQTTAALSLPQGEIIYSNTNGPGGAFDGPPGLQQPASLAPLPMIQIDDDYRSNNGVSSMRPRHDPTGPAWQDRSNPSSQQEILNQATIAADFNKSLGQQRVHREKFLEEYWKRPHEQPTPEPRTEASSAVAAGATANNSNAVMPPHLQSPQIGMDQSRARQNHLSHAGNSMLPQSYPGYANQQSHPMQSPVQNMHRSMQPSQLHHQSSPSMGMAGGGAARQTPSYNYPQQNQMWPPPPPHQQQQPPPPPQQQQQQQPQPSPLSQGHTMSQYSQHQSPMPPPPQIPQQGGMYGGMPGMNSPAAYGGMARSMYQPSPSPNQYNMSNQGNQPGMQGWNPPGSLPSEWQRYQ